MKLTLYAVYILLFAYQVLINYVNAHLFSAFSS